MTALSFDAQSPANLREYPHKPCLAKLLETSLGQIFAADSAGLSSFILIIAPKNVYNVL